MFKVQLPPPALMLHGNALFNTAQMIELGRQCPYTPEQMARRFHETYEHLAPLHDYVTREETREFNPDSQNGRLMIAVCRALFA